MEIVLVNSMSTDNTRAQMEEFAKRERENPFEEIIVKDNLKGNQASGWNVAIAAATGEVIIRGRCTCNVTFRLCEEEYELVCSPGEYVCGGARPNIAVKKGKWTDAFSSRKFFIWKQHCII